MIKPAADGTKVRILDAAQEIFTRSGYEAASVRSILEASGATAGSFYHFYPSKEALFEAVVERSLSDYADRLASAGLDGSLSPSQRLEAMLSELLRCSEEYYGRLSAGRLHWTVQYALHEKTMQAILPGVERTLESMLESGSLRSRLPADVRTLSAALLKGIEGILHAYPMEDLRERSLAERLDCVRAYVGLLVELKPE